MTNLAKDGRKMILQTHWTLVRTPQANQNRFYRSTPMSPSGKSLKRKSNGFNVIESIGTLAEISRTI